MFLTGNSFNWLTNLMICSFITVPMEAFDSEAACTAPASLFQTLSFLCEEGVCSAPSVTKYFPSPHREMKHEESVGSLKSISSGRSSNVFSCNTSQSWAITTICSKPDFIPWDIRFKSWVRVWAAQLSFYKYSSQGLSLLVKWMLDGVPLFFLDSQSLKIILQSEILLHFQCFYLLWI